MPLKVLSALDTARTQYYHFKAIIVAGMGLFTDAYDLFCIPPIMKLIGHVYYESNKSNKNQTPLAVESIIYYKSHQNGIPLAVESSILVVALLGTVIGQLVFGVLGDRVGRRGVYGLALMLMMAGSIGCGFSVGTTTGCVLGSLAFFRFLLGVGIGGDYPLSATIMSEYANKRTRGAFIAAVFSMQGFGILASSIVTMVICKIFERIYPSSPKDPTPKEADIAWRLILMLGAVPAGITFYWRTMMPETARYTALVEQNVCQAARDMERVLDLPLSQIAEDKPFPPRPLSPLFSRQFFLRHGRDLLACSATWFLIDFIFYSTNLMLSMIYQKYPDYEDASEKLTAFEAAFEVAKHQAIAACCFTIPGYFVAVFLIDRVGRVRIQAVGFLFMAIIYFSIGVPDKKDWKGLLNTLFNFLYGLTFFFANCGPNTTTFIMPAELFPARFRTTCHGIAGAAGKVGAMIGVLGFFLASRESEASGIRVPLMILGGISMVGMAVTVVLTRETMGRSLEENEDENESAQG